MKLDRAVQDRFSKKLVYMNFFLAVLIVMVHVYSTDYTGGLLDEEINFTYIYVNLIQGYFCQIAVPMFFAISGFLFYKNFKIENLFMKWRSRIRSLVVPYLLWNTLAFLFYYVISNFSFTKNLLSMEPIELSIENVFLGVFLHSHTVLWFVALLILFVMMAPLFYILLKEKKIAIGCVFLFCAITLFYPHNSINSFSYMLSFYFLGAYSGKYCAEVIIKRHSRKNAIIAIGIMLITFFTAFLTKNNILYYVFKLSWVLLLWFALDVFREFKEPKSFMRMSFWMYCTHRLFVRISEKIIWSILPMDYMCVGILLTLVLTIAGVLLSGVIFKLVMPQIWEVLNGGR